jgi:hypothetical protein
MSKQQGTKAVVQTEHGVTAEITLFEDYSYEVNSIVRKSALGGQSLREIGKMIAELPGDDSAGSDGSYARIDLV